MKENKEFITLDTQIVETSPRVTKNNLEVLVHPNPDARVTKTNLEVLIEPTIEKTGILFMDSFDDREVVAGYEETIIGFWGPLDNNIIPDAVYPFYSGSEIKGNVGKWSAAFWNQAENKHFEQVTGNTGKALKIPDEGILLLRGRMNSIAPFDEQTIFSSNNKDFTIGFSIKLESSPVADITLIELSFLYYIDSVKYTEYYLLKITPDLKLKFIDNNNNVNFTSVTSLNLDIFQYLEMRLIIAGGSKVELFINGENALDNTQAILPIVNGSDVIFYSVSLSGPCIVDDLYMGLQTPTPKYPIKIIAQVPIADSITGRPTNFTPSSYTYIDECYLANPSRASGFIGVDELEATSSPSASTFGFGDIEQKKIHAVQQMVWAGYTNYTWSNFSNFSFTPIINVNGIDFEGEAVELLITRSSDAAPAPYYGYLLTYEEYALCSRHVWNNNPLDSTNWNKRTLNENTEFGIKVPTAAYTFYVNAQLYKNYYWVDAITTEFMVGTRNRVFLIT